MTVVRLSLLAVLAAALFAVPLHAGNGPAILAAVNAQRTANGIPAVTWNADWAAKCGEFDTYAIRNGWDAQPHGETPGKAGYSADGGWAASQSVLSQGRENSFLANPPPGRFQTPWEWAPIHLMQILAPSISQMGGDQTGSYSCLTTWPGMTTPPLSDTPTFYSYPGNGTSGIYALEQPNEWPTTPEKELGLGDNATTGPNIFVYAEGFSSATTVLSASLTDSTGRASQLVWWDAKLASLQHSNSPGSVMLIPTQPLIGHTSYSVSLTLDDARPAVTTTRYNRQTHQFDKIVVRPAYNATASDTFSFTTGACSACRHLPDQPAGLLGLHAGSGASFVVSSNGESTPQFTVSQLKAGALFEKVCRTALTGKQVRGHSRCRVWTQLGHFTLSTPFGDGDTTVQLRTLLRARLTGLHYRLTVMAGGRPLTITVSR